MNMDNIVEESISPGGFPENFEALFKLLDEWRIKVECLKKYAAEKTIEENKHAIERLEKALAMFDKLSQCGCEFFTGISDREKEFAKHRSDSINSDQLLLEIKEINAGFEKLYSSFRKTYCQSSAQLKVASDVVQKARSSFTQKKLEWKKLKLSRTTSESGVHDDGYIHDGNLTLKQNKIHKKLKDSEKQWEASVDEANAKDWEFERIKDEIAEKIYEHVETTEKALKEILTNIRGCLNCAGKHHASNEDSENSKSNLLGRLEAFRRRERSRMPRFTFDPAEEVTRTPPLSAFSPPTLRKNKRKSSEPILDSMKSKTLTAGREPDKSRNSLTEFSNLSSDTKIKMIKMSLTHVDNHGLECMGIYRKSGSETRFRVLSEKMLLSDGDDCDEIFPATDICTIGKYTKTLLMKASELLFTKKVKQEILKIFKRVSGDEISTSRLEELKTCLKKLPPKNEALLMMVFQHLNKVASKSDTNLMTTSNLAVVFSPALFNYCSEGSIDFQFRIWPKVTEVFINDYRFLFDLDSTNDHTNQTNEVIDNSFQENSPLPQNLSQIPEKLISDQLSDTSGK